MATSPSIPGGWVMDPKQPTQIPRSLRRCFYTALNDQVGAKYAILLQLGYQVVAGTNYLLLCQETLTTNPPTKSLVTVVIYKDLNGNCSVTSVMPAM